MKRKGMKDKQWKYKELECPILTAASTPLAPRLECAVFGCRNSDRDPVSFHPLPQNPDIRSQWLKLINRQDLADKPRFGQSRAVVCSIHFPPEQITDGILALNAVPSLCLPTKKNQFILELDASSELLPVPVKAETMTEDDLISEVFQPESPPTDMTPHNIDPLSTDQTNDQMFKHTTPGNSEGNTQLHTAPILLSRLAGHSPVIPNIHIPDIQPFKTTQMPQLHITNVSSRLLHPQGNQFPTKQNLPVQRFEISPLSNLPHPQGNKFKPTKQNLPVQIEISPICNLPHLQGNQFQPTKQNLPVKLEISPICKIPKKSVPFYKQVESSLVVTYADNQRNIEAQTNSGEAFRRYATYSAVENISIPSNRLAEILNRSAECQTCPELVEILCAEFKKTFDKELETAKQELRKAENPFMGKTEFMKGCDKYLDEKIANFVKSHAHLSNKFAEKKYPAEFMIFALKLFLLNPKSYRFVEGFFNLPSKESIQRFRMPVKSGYNENLMECLKVKVNQMSNLGRQCVVCFEVIPLKKNLYYDIGIDYLCGMQEIDGVVGDNLAEYAAIIAVRGLNARWKQPISFALLSEKKRLPETKAWLDKTIEALSDIGLNIKALVTSPDDEFLDVPEEPYFEMKSGKIYRIIDFLELLKIARDELMQYECRIGGYLVKWEHIQDIFDADKAQELNLLPNLTEKHVRPDAESQNDVKTATELFSSNIAAAMHFYVAARLQNKDARHTAKFLTKMKDLYDIMASRKTSKAFQTATSKALKEILEYFNTMQLKGKYGNVIGSKFVFGLNFSINSIKSLAADMKKCNVNLLTRNLTKDFMEDYFEQNGQMTPIVFTREFRKLCLAYLLQNTKKTATGDDIMSTIVKISEYVHTDMNEVEKDEDSKKISIDVNDYKFSWPSNEYIAGYLLWKCLEKHTCEICVKNICDFYRFEESRDILIDHYKFYNSKNVNKLCKIRPPRPVVNFVDQIELKFNEYYYSVKKNNSNFAWNVYCTMEKDYFGLPCEYFPIQYFKMLYIRLKIFSSIKEYHKRRITIR